MNIHNLQTWNGTSYFFFFFCYKMWQTPLSRYSGTLTVQQYKENNSMCIVNNSTWRIWHQPIRCAPYHPSSNRAVERFVQMFKRVMKLERGKHSCYISDCSVQPRERENKLEFGWGLWACSCSQMYLTAGSVTSSTAFQVAVVLDNHSRGLNTPYSFLQHHNTNIELAALKQVAVTCS